MLNYRNTRIFFAVLLLLTIFLDWKYALPFWIYPIIVIVYLAITAYGSYYIQSDFFLRSLWKGSEERKAIAITFDDGPLADFTPKVLDILKENNAHAAFFLIGKNIEGNEAMVKQIDSEGHIIGNHSYSHTYWFSLNKSETMLKDLKQCDDRIFKVINKKPKFFRPPYGVINPMVKSAIEKGNYDCIGWSVRTYDTVAKSKGQLLTKSLKNLKNGDILLFHDWAPHTIGILSDFIKEAHSRGFEIVRVDKLLNTNAYY